VLKHIDEGGPAQALTKAPAMTAEVRQALDGLDEEASVDEVATRLEGKVSPAVLVRSAGDALHGSGPVYARIRPRGSVSNTVAWAGDPTALPWERGL
jgi:hypothetical protein